MTQLKSLITPTAALLAAFTLTAAPVFAQNRPHGGQGQSGQQSGGAQQRSEGQRPQAGASPRVETRQEAPRAQAPQQQQQQQQARPAEAPRAQQRDAQVYRGQQQQQQRGEAQRNDGRQRDYGRAQGDYGRSQDRRGEVGRAVPRREVIVPRGGYSPRYSPRYSQRGYGSRSYYRPYVFRPRFSIGFGIYSGYPVPYTYSYPYPIEVYGYGAPRSNVMITPGASAYGGVALEITPYDADVWVDGEYAGKVQDFDGTEQPLTLTPGTHRIEVQAAGYEPMTVDVGIQSGQVIPYRGDLRPY